MTTQTNRATVFNQSGWNNPSNAVDAGSGTFADWSSPASTSNTSYLETFGFSIAGTLVSVTATVKSYQAGAQTHTVQGYVGATAKGSPVTLTPSTTSSNVETVTLTGLTLANVNDSTFRVKYVANAQGFGINQFLLDYIDVTVSYTVAFTGSAALSGTGTLAPATQPGPKPAVALAGGGTLAVTTLLPKPGVAVALSGTGTLSVAATSHADIFATVALSGTGALTTTARPTASGTATLAGTGTLSTTAAPRWAVTVALAGAGTLTVQTQVLDILTAVDDVSGLADAATRATLLVRTGSDDVSGLTDAAVQIRLLPRTAGDDVSSTFSEALSQSGSVYARSGADSAPAIDDGTRQPITFARSAADDISGLSDAATRSGVFGRALTDFTLPAITNLIQYPATTDYVSSAGFGTGNATASSVAAGGDGYLGESYRRATMYNPYTPGAGLDLILHQPSTYGISTLGMSIPTTLGQPYSIAVPVRCSVAQKVRVQAQGITSGGGGNFISASDVTLVPNTWTVLTLTNYVPTGGTLGVRIDVDIASASPIAWQAGNTLDVGRPWAFAGAALPSVVGDGNTAGWQWLGAAEASVSIGPDLNATLDSSTRSTLLVRTAVDDVSSTLSDAATRATVESRTTADDTSALSDAATRATVEYRTGAEDISGLSDAATRAMTSLRPSPDSIAGLSDAATRATVEYRTADDDVSALTDEAAQIRLLPRPAEDTVDEPTDGADRALLLIRTSGDTAPAVDDGTRNLSTFFRAVPDSPAAPTDAGTRFVLLRRSGADTAPVADAAAQHRWLPRAGAEVLKTIREHAARWVALARSSTDSVTAPIDAPTHLDTQRRTGSETLSAPVEVLSRTVRHPRTAEDTILGRDRAERYAALLRASSDPLSPVTDSLLAPRLLLRSGGEEVAAPEESGSAVSRFGNPHLVPRIRIRSLTRTKVSRHDGYDTAEVSLDFDQQVIAWSVRRGGTSHLDGDLVDGWTATGEDTLDTSVATVSADLLRPGSNLLRVYARSTAGVWSR